MQVPSDIMLQEVHQDLLILLKKFHEICTENGIKYSLHGGTLLGAIREKGFIPWDDDADVTMMRSEYERLCTVMKDYELDEEFSFYSFERWSHFVMRRAGHPQIWIDILIYDYISDKRIFQECKILGIMVFNGMLKEKDGMSITNIKAKKKYGTLKYCLYYAAYLLGCVFPMRWKQDWFGKFSKYCIDGRKNLIHRSNDQYCAVKIILPKEVMSEFILVPFEDTELMVTKSYHEVLISSYGEDYMTPKRFDNVEFESHDIARKIFEERIE